MPKPELTLRMIFTSIVTTVALLALAVTGSVLVLSQYLSRTSSLLANSVESVRAAEETQIALLLHERATDRASAARYETEMLGNLAAMQRDALLGHAAQPVQEATQLVSAYIAAARSGVRSPELVSQHGAAYRILDAISDINVKDAQQARDAAARWDRWLYGASLSITALVLGLAGWLVWWMRTQAFQPLFELAEAMRRFGRGERDARAPESGPAELRDMVVRFNEMARMLSAQREAQIAFLGGVAHDLRNPLAALATSVQLIPPGEPLPPEPRIRRTLDLVRRQLTKLERMINDFMDMTKIDSGTLELHTARHDLRSLLREVVQLFEATAPGHRLELSLPDEALEVECDSLRVEQIVSNLMSNAIKYSPSAGQVEVALFRDSDAAVITVRDYGIGISEEDLEHLFEPFRRARLGQEKIPGAGLGLYVVRRLIDAHGGRIDVESVPGRGATFCVRLPLPRSEVSALAAGA
jgi:two-component system, OmpR family, sensor histidine kinase MtrB